MTSELPPLSLYVHLPWCVRKCPYCDFNSHTAGDAPPRARYVAALIADLRAEAAEVRGRELISVYFGGGTPSLFAPAEIARLLDAVAEGFALAADAEISMEANPGTVDGGDPAGFRSAGVNRLSIGAQSFAADALERLGRIHSVNDIGRAVDAARQAGFDNLNLDLMYGLPQQDVAAALDDIRAAAALEPEHLSWYQLTLEPNTVFYARPPAGLPDDALVADIQAAGEQLLKESGYAQYEVSAYCTAGRESRHNLNYWRFGDYLAVGAGAHGKVTGDDGIFRYAKPANPVAYMQSVEAGAVRPEMKPIAGADLVFEFLLNASRLRDGFDERLFERRTGLAAAELAVAAGPAVRRGLISRRTDGLWRPTELGRRFLNDLQAEFLA